MGKVAVLITGQPRLIKYGAYYGKKFFGDNVDYYVCNWNQIDDPYMPEFKNLNHNKVDDRNYNINSDELSAYIRSQWQTDYVLVQDIDQCMTPYFNKTLINSLSSSQEIRKLLLEEKTTLSFMSHKIQLDVANGILEIKERTYKIQEEENLSYELFKKTFGQYFSLIHGLNLIRNIDNYDIIIRWRNDLYADEKIDLCEIQKRIEYEQNKSELIKKHGTIVFPSIDIQNSRLGFYDIFMVMDRNASINIRDYGDSVIFELLTTYENLFKDAYSFVTDIPFAHHLWAVYLSALKISGIGLKYENYVGIGTEFTDVKILRPHPELFDLDVTSNLVSKFAIMNNN